VPELANIADVELWDDFQPNTDADDLARGMNVVRERSPDAIVGVGGGSAMDMAKLLCAFDDLDREELLGTIHAGQPIVQRHRALMLAPTTSGSGSEATHFAVVYIGDDKYSVAGPAMKADAVALDPELSMTAPAYQRATSGIDAVCQAIESLWAMGATSRSRQFARHALDYLMRSIEGFVHKPAATSAKAMSIGSHLSGRAIDISKTTAAHALSYAITKRYGISHGHAVAMTLGSFIEAHGKATMNTLRDGVDPAVHKAVIECVMDRLGASDPSEARKNFLGLLKRINLDPYLEIPSTESMDVLRQLETSLKDTRLNNNPVLFDEEDLLEILSAAVEL
jgi:alcohol dehydrogenase